MRKKLFWWQISGFIFTCILGVLLHFAYEWSNNNTIVASFSAINESTWEHLKLLYFPLLLFSLIEYFFLKTLYPNFWWAKFMGILAGLITIPVLYYTYTGIFGQSADWFNIAIFFIAVAIAFIVDTWILKKKYLHSQIPAIAIILIILIGAAFVFLTYSPIDIPLFKSPDRS